MTLIDVLHLAMLTDAGTADPGTDSPVNLVINDGTERLNHRFSDTNQDDQERGQANHYRLEVGLAEDGYPGRLHEDALLNDKVREASAGELESPRDQLDAKHRHLLAALSAAAEVTGSPSPS